MAAWRAAILPSGQAKHLHEWGISAPRARFGDQIVDECSFSVVTDPRAPSFEYDNRVVITKDGREMFLGRVIAIELQVTAQTDRLLVTLAGVWHELEQLIFSQTWYGLPAMSVAGASHTHVLLNAKAGGGLATVGEQITSIIAYAAANGVSVQAGNILPAASEAFTPAIDQRRDISCAEAIRLQLRYIPSAVMWFDYTTTPPTAHVRKPAFLVTDTADLEVPPADPYRIIEGFNIRPRWDLRRPAVVIRFETTSMVDGEPRLAISQEVYPPGSTGAELRALNLSLDLRGPSYQTLTAKLATRDQAYDLAAMTTAFPLIFPAFDSAKIANLTVNDCKMYNVDVTAAKVFDTATGQNDLSLENLNYEVVWGQVADWMLQAGAAAHKVKQLFTISYDVLESAGGATLRKVVDQVIARETVLTNVNAGLGGQTYSATQLTEYGDPQPAGMAEFLYNELSTMYLEGGFTLREEEVTRAGWSMGHAIALVDPPVGWPTQIGIIREVVEDWETGVTRFRFGPSPTLTFRDLVEFYRVSRERRRTVGYARGNDNSDSAASQNKLGDQAANHDSFPSAAPMKLMVVRSGSTVITFDAENGRITMEDGSGAKFNASLADFGGKEITARSTEICVNNVTQTVLVMRSAP